MSGFALYCFRLLSRKEQFVKNGLICWFVLIAILTMECFLLVVFFLSNRTMHKISNFFHFFQRTKMSLKNSSKTPSMSLICS